MTLQARALLTRCVLGYVFSQLNVYVGVKMPSFYTGWLDIG